MKLALAILIALHGAIHFLGVVKGFQLAEVPQLATPIARPFALLWLLAALALLATAVMLFVWPQRWWVAGVVALVASQAAILSAWSDAKFGTLPNLIVLVPLALAILDLRSSSLPSTYRREVNRRLVPIGAAQVVTESDLAILPNPLQDYLRAVGVVGRPRVQSFSARWRGRMRNGQNGGWMDIRARQVDFFDDPARLFYMEASRGAVPFQALHVYAGASATMRVRVASVFDVVDARGPEMDRSETVTLFNDMCLLAPASLLGADVAWRRIDDRRVLGTFTNANHTISAGLHFDALGRLVNFVSHDRDQSADGKTFRNLPWSTPVRAYRRFGGLLLPAVADAVWTEPTGDFAYARFELEDIVFNAERQDARVRANHALSRVQGAI